MDSKTPRSDVSHKNHYKNLPSLKATDQLKVVICDHIDDEWTKNLLIRYQSASLCEILLSPCYDEDPVRKLADWIL